MRASSGDEKSVLGLRWPMRHMRAKSRFALVSVLDGNERAHWRCLAGNVVFPCDDNERAGIEAVSAARTATALCCWCVGAALVLLWQERAHSEHAAGRQETTRRERKLKPAGERTMAKMRRTDSHFTSAICLERSTIIIII